MSETTIVVTRSVEIVTAEIQTIQHNVTKVIFDGVVEIGKRLEEVKALVPHGEWTEYLEAQLGYKPSTAQNYMRIAREFGGIKGTDSEAYNAFETLGYSQLLPLLGLPEEDRQELAEENELSGMSSREIAALVKERDEAKQAAEHLQAQVDEAEKNLQKVDKVKAQLEKEKAEHKADAGKIKELSRELEELKQKAQQPAEISPEVMEQMRNEITAEQAAAVKAAEARAAEAAEKLHKVKNPALHQVNFLFTELQTIYQRLQSSIMELTAADPETADKLRGAIQNCIKEWEL